MFGGRLQSVAGVGPRSRDILRSAWPASQDRVRGHEGNTMDIWGLSEKEIVQAINDDSIDEENLVDRDAWKMICEARGRNFNLVDAEAWQSLCARRGYVLYRRNPRGF